MKSVLEMCVNRYIYIFEPQLDILLNIKGLNKRQAKSKLRLMTV